ncbi:hypothetical protein C8J57DRAFT_1225891 [Mycena rebaudengoi]|nr:hypothetical protein C8J57DRAFT_1225891 [Mycena rebaudengoi]
MHCTAADKNLQVPPLPPTPLHLSACAPERAPLRFFGPKCSRCSVTTLRRHGAPIPTVIVSPRAQFSSSDTLAVRAIHQEDCGTVGEGEKVHSTKGQLLEGRDAATTAAATWIQDTGDGDSKCDN